MKKIFIDGKAGTTGLRIYERLESRKDVSLILLSEEDRKDPKCRKRAINESDITFLCLPDAAAIEAVEMVESSNTVIIDTSTAHRTAEGWLYGFPEIQPDFTEKIKIAHRIAVPGCHASGFLALIQPLVAEGILPGDIGLTCTSVTGYSGGGKNMIADYAEASRSPLLAYPRQYGLTQQHKHLREMKAVTGLSKTPVFMPIVADFYSGMEVTVPLFAEDLVPGKGIEDILTAYQTRYNGKIVHLDEAADESGFLSAGAYAMRDDMSVAVFGNEERIILTARYDNLGKGASGAALECLNYVLGLAPETGLIIE